MQLQSEKLPEMLANTTINSRISDHLMKKLQYVRLHCCDVVSMQELHGGLTGLSECFCGWLDPRFRIMPQERVIGCVSRGWEEEHSSSR